MERPVDPYYNGYGDSGGMTDGAVLAALGAFVFVGFIFAVAIYVVTAIFQMKLLKNAGHRTPGSAWVPLWNTASLFEIGGIKQPWIWVAVLFGGNFLGGLIPGIGFLISLVVLAASIVLMVWVAKGVQAGLGISSVGGIVLAVLVPLAWIIWMAVVSGKRKYDRNAALMEGGSLPMNWFGENDRLAPFGVASAPAGNFYAQPQQHQGGTPQSWTSQSNSPYAAPQAQQQSWNAPEPHENRETELPQTPPAPPAPRYESPLPPQGNEEDGTDRGGRQL